MLVFLALVWVLGGAGDDPEDVNQDHPMRAFTRRSANAT